MNYLIIILMAFAFLKNKSGKTSNFLNGISYEDVLPILKLFDGTNLFANVNLNAIKNVLDGNINFQEILPLITSFMGAFNNESKPTYNSEINFDGVAKIILKIKKSPKKSGIF